MLKIAMFQTVEEYKKYLEERIELEEKAVETAKQELAEADRFKKSWLKFNMIEYGTEAAERAWESHMKWLVGNVSYAERKLKKTKKELSKIA